MRAFTSDLTIKKELRRRGWWEAIVMLKRRRTNWFVQDANSILLCVEGGLLWRRVDTPGQYLEPFSLQAARRACRLVISKRSC
jgi:hypothetical protein